MQKAAGGEGPGERELGLIPISYSRCYYSPKARVFPPLCPPPPNLKKHTTTHRSRAKLTPHTTELSEMLKFVSIAATLALATTTSAVPNHGLDFVTIGDPGNPPTDPAMLHPSLLRPLGAVNYKYRLTRTEITYDHQLEFLEAYTTYREGGDILQSQGEISFFFGGWHLNEGSENRPGRMSPRLWMRYCNWLHNDKALTADAFESGAYDTSTFGEDEDGNLTDQMTRSEGARFWIPSLDEWVKGGYYDPNRFGEGEDGYWLYPHSSDARPQGGLPGEGGETNAQAVDPPLDAGSYPNAQSPWGLLDYSGGQPELAERLGPRFYLLLGSVAEFGDTGQDRLGTVFVTSSTAPIPGLRLASVVPAPGAGVFLVGITSVLARRRR